MCMVHAAVVAPDLHRLRTSSVADELMPMPCCSQSENLGIEASRLLNSSVALASTVTGEPRTALDCMMGGARIGGQSDEREPCMQGKNTGGGRHRGPHHGQGNALHLQKRTCASPVMSMG